MKLTLEMVIEHMLLGLVNTVGLNPDALVVRCEPKTACIEVRLKYENPWAAHKCVYCNFRIPIDQYEYLNAPDLVEQEIKAALLKIRHIMLFGARASEYPMDEIEINEDSY